MNTVRHLPRRMTPLAAAVLAALALPAGAQPVRDLTSLTLEQLLDVDVVTVSKFEQKASAAAAALTVVTADEIRTYGWRTLGDVLRSIRGFYVTYDRQYQYAGVRGFSPPGDYNTRLLVLLDGYRVNDNIYDSGFIGNEFPLDLDLVERIEIVRGPNSSVYGHNALFGVVNVITRRPSDMPAIELAAGVGSGDAKEGRATLAHRFGNGTELLLSATGFDANGRALAFTEAEFANPENNFGRADGTDFQRYGKFFGKLAAGPFTLAAGHSRRVKGIPTGFTGVVINDTANDVIDESSFADLSWYGDLDASTRLTARVFGGYYRYDGGYLYDWPPLTRNEDAADGSWWGGELRLVKNWERHTLVTGAEYQRNARQEQRNFDLAPGAQCLGSADTSQPCLDVRRHGYRVGIYAQDEWRVTDTLSLTGGLRLDDDDIGEPVASPRLAAVWKPAAPTTVKLAYASAFRSPNAYESDYAYPLQQEGNAHLDREEIQTWSAVAEHYLDSHTRVLGAAFYYRIDQLIGQQTNPDTGLLQFRNQDTVSARGIELEAERSWDGGARVRASYSLADAEDSGGTQLENSPQHMLKLNLALPLAGESLVAGAEGQYLSSRRTSAGEVGGYTTANLTLSGRIKPWNIHWSASARNLFDHKIDDPAAFDVAVPSRDRFEQDGRSVWFKVVVGF